MSIVLKVKDIARINILITIREFLLLRIKSKKAKSGITFEFSEYDIKPESMTDRYKCRKCGSRKCSYYEMQTRSADEPMTQFLRVWIVKINGRCNYYIY